MSENSRRRMDYHLMVLLALIIGFLGIALQFAAGFEILSFMLSVVVLGTLIGGRETFKEQDRQQLDLSYKTAFVGLLLTVVVAYAITELSRWLEIEAAVNFMSGHWPGLILAMMCLLMGIAGLQKRWPIDAPA